MPFLRKHSRSPRELWRISSCILPWLRAHHDGGACSSSSRVIILGRDPIRSIGFIYRSPSGCSVRQCGCPYSSCFTWPSVWALVRSSFISSRGQFWRHDHPMVRWIDLRRNRRADCPAERSRRYSQADDLAPLDALIWRFSRALALRPSNSSDSGRRSLIIASASTRLPWKEYFASELGETIIETGKQLRGSTEQRRKSVASF
jgi:hypothetical protein